MSKKINLNNIDGYVLKSPNDKIVSSTFDTNRQRTIWAAVSYIRKRSKFPKYLTTIDWACPSKIIKTIKIRGWKIVRVNLKEVE